MTPRRQHPLSRKSYNAQKGPKAANSKRPRVIAATEPKPGSKAFERLQAAWYQKAAKSGFKDIEDTTNGMLKTWDSAYFYIRHKKNPLGFETKHQYFYKATQWAQQYKFDYVVERKIWLLHLAGLQNKQIEKKLGKSKTFVLSVLKKLRAAFLLEHT